MTLVSSPETPTHFIRQLITDDLQQGRHKAIVTRFPPEPNGYLHVGHAKSICLNFGIAAEFSGRCILRFDDTNPLNEEEEYVQAIIEDVEWLGFKWAELTYASDYYQQLFDFALHLIQHGLAYVDSLTLDEIRAYRGTLQEPGRESPYRNRSIEENKDLFLRMRAGEFADGTHVLRARIDMQSGNLNLRDPVLYRIRHTAHQRTGDAWCIYPMYDFAHPISDALEHITHSLCTLEFQDHRPLYDWFITHLPVPAIPKQTEFARLNVSHTVTSKRKLRQLVESGAVNGWDDPRLPTLRGMRKRGYPAEALRQFCDQISVSRSDSVIDMSVLEACVRDVLNREAPRALCVLEPLKIVIDNLPDDYRETLNIPWFSNNASSESREVPFSKTLYIERSDFMQEPSKHYFRLAPGKEVRLRHAYILKCDDVVLDAKGEIDHLRCSIDKDTLGKNPVDRKVKGVIHWVSSPHAVPIDVLQYDRLFLEENPAAVDDLMACLNPESCTTVQGLVEPAVALKKLGDVFQFERVGYYAIHEVNHGHVQSCHRVVNLKDTWAKLSLEGARHG
ncbi:MAG: glutamine--tRNA ligase [Legionella sp. 21-45-4]|nr:MAG: glutamine--tRNA ligase [Legionella sp. 21-45-4]